MPALVMAAWEGSRGVLSGFDGHHAASGDGLRFALRVRTCFGNHLANGSQQESMPTIDGCATVTPWEIARRHEKVEVKLSCSFKLRDGTVRGDSKSGHPARSRFLSIVQL